MEDSQTNERTKGPEELCSELTSEVYTPELLLSGIVSIDVITESSSYSKEFSPPKNFDRTATPFPSFTLSQRIRQVEKKPYVSTFSDAELSALRDDQDIVEPDPVNQPNNEQSEHTGCCNIW